MDSRDRPLQNIHHQQQLQATHQNRMMGQNPYPTPMPNNNNNNNNNPNSAAAQMMSSSRFPFNPMMVSVCKPESPNAAAGGSYDGSQSELRSGHGGFNIDSAKKKRGRPRKYSPDGNIALGLSPTPITSSAVSGDPSGAHSSEPRSKKHRGRPAGTGKKQMDALGTGGVGFTPHVILVNPGEDIASKVMAFTQQGPRTVCILSAHGAVCNVSLHQPTLASGTVIYEGRYEIISLSGSFLISESNGNRSRTGGLCVSLASADGQVLGGIANMLTAASTVQVIVGSFIVDVKKLDSSIHKSGQSSASGPSNMLNFSAPAALASPSDGASNDSSDANGGSPLSNRGHGIYTNANQPIHNAQMYQLWGNRNQQ